MSLRISSFDYTEELLERDDGEVSIPSAKPPVHAQSFRSVST